MPKTKISEFSATPGNNTDIDGINISEGCAPSGINDAIRELMAQLKDFQAGTAGDSFNGPVGTTTAAAGAFTNLSASGTFALTGDQVQISEGGTGQTTANAAFNALAPSQATHAGKYLKTDGTNTSWDALDISTADITGTLPVANGGTGVTSSTGTGSVVLSASPTFTGTVNGAALTLSSNFTLSGGTANGVAYLNGSKVLTTGAALTFDGTNFGVGTTTPNTAAYGGSVVGIYGSGNNGGNIWLTSDTQTDGQRTGRIGFGTEGNTTNKETARIWSLAEGTTATNIGGQLRFNTKADGGTLAERYRITADGTSIWSVAGAEGMRLTSTGLGIGTSSPGVKLQVNGDIRSLGTSNAAVGAFAASTTSPQFVLGNSSGTTHWVIYQTLGGSGQQGSFKIYDAVTASDRVTLDTSGNLGLGVTPSAWTSGGRALDVSSAGTFAFTGGLGTIVAYNAFHNGTNWIYKASTGAKAFVQDSANQYWLTAGSGTAGNTISFTQALTLDASGNLGIGTTSPSTRLHAKGTGGTIATFERDASGTIAYFNRNTGSGNAGAIIGADSVAGYFAGGNSTSNMVYLDSVNNLAQFYTNNTERARITSGGNLLVGTTTNTYSSKIVSNDGITDFGTQFNVNSTGVEYNFVQRAASRAFNFYVDSASVIASLSNTGVWTNASDARYKENVQPTKYGLDAVMQLKPREYNLIGQSKKQVGFIAQEVLDVVPEVVDSVSNSITNEDRYTLSYGQMTAVLTKAIQELKAQNDELRARVAALETK